MTEITQTDAAATTAAGTMPAPMEPTPMGPKLYELTEEARALYDAIARNGGVLEDWMAETLDEIEPALDAKLLRCCHMVRNYEADASFREAQAAIYKAEYERLISGAKIATNAAKDVKRYVATCLERAGIREREVGTFTVRLQKNPKLEVKCESPEQLPEELRVEAVTYTVNYDAVKSLVSRMAERQREAMELHKNGMIDDDQLRDELQLIDDMIPAGLSARTTFHARIS
jgi:hypothetical protein